jgi:hypothetical protein
VTYLMRLIDWLWEQLAEDERVASAAAPGPWRLGDEGEDVIAVDGIQAAEAFALNGPQARATAAFIAANDPARVLAEVAARRAIVARCHAAFGDGTTSGAYLAEDVLRELAQPYASRPGFRPEWAGVRPR